MAAPTLGDRRWQAALAQYHVATLTGRRGGTRIMLSRDPVDQRRGRPLSVPSPGSRSRRHRPLIGRPGRLLRVGFRCWFAGQVPDGEVFDHQRPEPAGQVSGGLMQRVAALVSDPPLSLPQRHRRAVPPVRRLLPGPPIRPSPPRHSAGQAANLPQRPAQVPGIGDLLPRRQDGRVLIPRSAPTTAQGAAGGGRDTSCPAVNAANQRPRSNLTDTPITRA